MQEKQISQIDSLYKVVDSVSFKLNKINKDTIKNRFQLFKVMNDTVSKHFHEVRNDESWSYICNFQNVRKPFKTMVFNYDLYKSNIDSSKKQLIDLKHDVEKGLVKEKNVNSYLKIESQLINTVCIKVMKNIDQVNAQMKNFDTVQPYLFNLIKEHKAK
ncbi:MAG: hypothetical protein WCQ95_10135 [Bacteroidota bacterium]